MYKKKRTQFDEEFDRESINLFLNYGKESIEQKVSEQSEESNNISIDCDSKDSNSKEDEHNILGSTSISLESD